MAISDERLNHAIAAVYGAVGVQDGFTAVLPLIRKLLNGTSAMLFTPLLDADAGGFGFVDHFNPNLFRDYRARIAKNPVWAREAAKKGLLFTGSTLTDEALISPEALHKEAFFAEFMRPMDLWRICATVVTLDEDSVLPRTFLCVFGGARARPFTEEQRRALEALSPHVAQALKLAYRLEAADDGRDTALAALHRMNYGVVLLDRDKRASFVNGPADTMCRSEQAEPALRYSPSDDRLRATQPRDDAALQTALDQAMRDPAEASDELAPALAPVPLRCSRGNVKLLATVLPLPRRTRRFVPRPAVAVAFIEDLVSRNANDTALFGRVFGLTEAERRVADALIAGEHAASIAERFSISVNTVRTHIKALYQKTHTKRIGALIALLARIGGARATAAYSTAPGSPDKLPRKPRTPDAAA